MTKDEIINALGEYEAQLNAILSRFTKSRDSVDINPADHPRFKQIVLQLRDLFDDQFVDGQRHTQPLIAYFSESISNYTGSPSFRGVENVKGVVSAALTRVKSNPLALKQAAPIALPEGTLGSPEEAEIRPQNGPQVKKKQTIKEHVEAHPVVWFFGTLVTGFLAGIGAYKAILEIARLEVVPRAQVGQAIPQPQNSLSTDGVKIDTPRGGDTVPWTFPVVGHLERLPEGTELWLITTDASGQRYWPQERAIARSDKSWTARVRGIGGDIGARRSFGVFLVGRDGQALLSLWERASLNQPKLELTRLTQDIRKLHEVDVIVGSGRP